MAQLLLLSKEKSASSEILPALGLLSHQVRVAPISPNALADLPPADVTLLDARADLVSARAVSRMLSSGTSPVLAVVTEAALTALSGDWGLCDFVLTSAGPGEVEARIRLALSSSEHDEVISSGGIEIDEAAYAARLNGEPLDLTYTEFELLKYLVQHPGRVFSREQLLSDVWGYDYYGGTRTVDVHVRRLRAKLGPEHESMIGTVRNVGYRLAVR